MPDVWIIHAPKFQNRYPSLGNYVSLQWMALGVLGLADALRSAGFEARVAHLGLERALDPAFDLAGLLRRSPCRLAAISIHFHQQLHDGLRAAAAIKAAQPDLPVVLGGLTATFFAEEIVRRFPQVDAVIAGEGEDATRSTDVTLKGKVSSSAKPEFMEIRRHHAAEPPTYESGPSARNLRTHLRSQQFDFGRTCSRANDRNDWGTHG